MFSRSHINRPSGQPPVWLIYLMLLAPVSLLVNFLLHPGNISAGSCLYTLGSRKTGRMGRIKQFQGTVPRSHIPEITNESFTSGIVCIHRQSHHTLHRGGNDFSFAVGTVELCRPYCPCVAHDCTGCGCLFALAIHLFRRRHRYSTNGKSGTTKLDLRLAIQS